MDGEESDSDWLEDAQQGGSRDPLVESEWTRLATKYSDAGYREGITDGKLSTLQSGFDEGFANSVPASRRLGRLRGRANGLLAWVVKQQSSSTASSNPPTVSSTNLDSLVEDARNLVKDLARVKRDLILPIDHERHEHERDEHDGEDVFELDRTDKREMESLEDMLEGISGGPPTSQGGVMREGQLLDSLEARLVELEVRIFGPPHLRG